MVLGKLYFSLTFFKYISITGDCLSSSIFQRICEDLNKLLYKIQERKPGGNIRASFGLQSWASPDNIFCVELEH